MGSKGSKVKKTRDVKRDGLPLFFCTKEPTKKRGHLITQPTDQRERVKRKKEGDRWGHEVHLSFVCFHMNVYGYHPREGVKARKQVSFVLQGVMRKVMRVWVSRATHYKCTMTGTWETQGSRGTEKGWSTSMKIG